MVSRTPLIIKRYTDIKVNELDKIVILNYLKIYIDPNTGELDECTELGDYKILKTYARNYDYIDELNLVEFEKLNKYIHDKEILAKTIKQKDPYHSNQFLKQLINVYMVRENFISVFKKHGNSDYMNIIDKFFADNSNQLLNSKYGFPSIQSWGELEIIMDFKTSGSLPELVFKIGKSSFRKHPSEIGVTLKKNRNEANQLLESLTSFANCNGRIEFGNNNVIEISIKAVSRLRKFLKDLFSLSDNPISNYSKNSGYNCNFTIKVKQNSPLDDITNKGKYWGEVPESLPDET